MRVTQCDLLPGKLLGHISPSDCLSVTLSTTPPGAVIHGVCSELQIVCLDLLPNPPNYHIPNTPTSTSTTERLTGTQGPVPCRDPSRELATAIQGQPVETRELSTNFWRFAGRIFSASRMLTSRLRSCIYYIICKQQNPGLVIPLCHFQMVEIFFIFFSQKSGKGHVYHHLCFSYNDTIFIYSDIYLGLISDLSDLGRAMCLTLLHQAATQHREVMWEECGDRKKQNLGVPNRYAGKLVILQMWVCYWLYSFQLHG